MHDYTPAFVSLQVLLAVLIWTTSATAGALIGTPKGRATEGALWGLLLGPIGIAIAALLPKRVDLPQPDLGTGPSFSGVTYAKPGAFKSDEKRRGTLGDGMR